MLFPSPKLALLAVAMTMTSAPARADDGQDHAFAMRRPTSAMSVGDSLETPTLSGFDPGDPRIGLILIAAYGPSPLLIVDSVAAEAEWGRAFTTAEIIAAAVGLVAATWSLVDALGRDGSANIALGSLAAAHAISWNLQLMTNAVARMVFGTFDQATELPWWPTFMTFPVDGGAGVLVRWMN